MKKENKKKYYLYQMDTVTLSIVPIILLAIVVLITYYVSNESIGGMINIFYDNPGIILISMLGYLAFHEILHSIAYVIYGGKFDKIIYGIELEKGILYCLCKQNISKNNILHSLLYPFFFIGILTYVISILFDLPLLLLLSIFNLSGCAGDLVMFAFISRLPKDIEFSELDDSVSFAIYTDKDISKRKQFGIKYISVNDELERKDFEKIKVSTLSKYVVICLIVLSIISFLVK